MSTSREHSIYPELSQLTPRAQVADTGSSPSAIHPTTQPCEPALSKTRAVEDGTSLAPPNLTQQPQLALVPRLVHPLVPLAARPEEEG